MTVLALRSIPNADPGFGSIFDPAIRGSASQAAQIWLANPIAEGARLPKLSTDTVCASGWFSDTDDTADTADAPSSTDTQHAAPIPPDMRTWTAPGWESFERVAVKLDQAAEQAGAEGRGVSVIFRPHARHVLADPQSTLAWLKRTSPKNLKVLLDPAAWLTAGMLDHAEDHLARAFASFTGHPAVWGTVLTDLKRWGKGVNADELVACPIGTGELRLETMLAALGPYDLAAKPVVLLEEDFEAQNHRLTRTLGA